MVDADGLRQAALLLHSMPLHDRRWMLAQLKVDECASLQGMLSELAELGIPSQHELLCSVTRSPLRRRAATVAEPDISGRRPTGDSEITPHISDNPVMQGMHTASPEAIVQVLRNEPASLVARLLRMADWVWSGQVLQQFGALKRRQIESCLERVSTSHAALDEMLLSLLLQRIQAVTDQLNHDKPVQSFVHPVPWWKKIRAGWRLRFYGRGHVG